MEEWMKCFAVFAEAKIFHELSCKACERNKVSTYAKENIFPRKNKIKSLEINIFELLAKWAWE